MHFVTNWHDNYDLVVRFPCLLFVCWTLKSPVAMPFICLLYTQIPSCHAFKRWIHICWNQFLCWFSVSSVDLLTWDFDLSAGCLGQVTLLWKFNTSSLRMSCIDVDLGPGVVVNGQKRHKLNLVYIFFDGISCVYVFYILLLHVTLSITKLLPLLSTFSNNCSILMIPLTWLTKQECVVFQTDREEHSKICTCTILHRQRSAPHQGEKDYGSETFCW
jgi:hypothetical protein